MKLTNVTTCVVAKHYTYQDWIDFCMAREGTRTGIVQLHVEIHLRSGRPLPELTPKQIGQLKARDTILNGTADPKKLKRKEYDRKRRQSVEHKEKERIREKSPLRMEQRRRQKYLKYWADPEPQREKARQRYWDKWLERHLAAHPELGTKEEFHARQQADYDRRMKEGFEFFDAEDRKMAAALSRERS